MGITRRRLLATTAGTAGVGTVGGCLGEGADGGPEAPSTPTVQSSFFVFDAIAARVAGSTADTELLVPVGQHGHGWSPGPRVREAIRGADLLVHGMEGFQPWIDDIRRDLEADGSGVATIDASADVALIEAGGGHDSAGDHGSGADSADPHFWMDPLRVKTAAGTVRDGLADVDPDAGETYAANAETFRGRLEELHGRIESTVADASNDVILVAGHDSFSYLADRYDVTIASLTNVSPDDRPTPRDIERAREIVEANDLRYVCVDPLASRRAAEQLVADTDLEGVLPLTAMPGVTERWAAEGWGYLEVMETVNLPTIQRVLDA
jgi:zinc transport system substrate-binding protein